MPKIIYPTDPGEICFYLDEGRGICTHCGALMNTVGDSFECPNCGKSIRVKGYEYDEPDDVEWSSAITNMYDGDTPGAGCMACGGPYPNCKTSCSIFDD